MRYVMLVLMTVVAFAVEVKAQDGIESIIESLAIKEIEEHRVIISSDLYFEELFMESERLRMRERIDEMANFACGLYKRYAVALSSSFLRSSNGGYIATLHLYACAIQ